MDPDSSPPGPPPERAPGWYRNAQGQVAHWDGTTWTLAPGDGALPPGAGGGAALAPAGDGVPAGEPVPTWSGERTVASAVDEALRPPRRARARGRAWRYARLGIAGFVLVGVGGVGGFLLAGQQAAAPAPTSVGGGATATAPTTVSGTMRHMGFNVDDTEGSTVYVRADDTTCELMGGFSDVNEGASVTVYDADGAIVGNARLGAGKTIYREDNGPRNYIAQCAFAFTVDVPSSPFFQVEVSHRGKVTVTAEEAGAVDLTLE